MKEENRKVISKSAAGEEDTRDIPGAATGNKQAPGPADTASAPSMNDNFNSFFKTKYSLGSEAEAGSLHELNKVTHGMLLAGLIISTVFIVVGLLMSGISHQRVPTAASSFHQMFENLKAGSASGFLNLGILLLIATPILRVFGSLAEFIHRRDWRYAAITASVLLILTISVLAGRG